MNRMPQKMTIQQIRDERLDIESWKWTRPASGMQLAEETAYRQPERRGAVWFSAHAKSKLA